MMAVITTAASESSEAERVLRNAASFAFRRNSEVCVFDSHPNNGAYFNGFGFTLNNRRVATKKSGTKKMAKTVAESMPPMVPVPIAF